MNKISSISHTKNEKAPALVGGGIFQRRGFMVWFWSFTAYSFLGFLLEATFAAAAGGRPNRKGLLVLPLCPVYGLGACLILLLPPWAAARPPALFALGALAATAAEYLAALYHEKVLGVSFWNYDSLPGSLQGRVCLPFSLAWGVLALGLTYWIHPVLVPWLARIPAPVSWIALASLLADGLLTAALLYRSGDIACLQWYRQMQPLSGAQGPGTAFQPQIGGRTDHRREQ